MSSVKVHFDHWKNAEYGSPTAHYRVPSSPKFQRSTNLFHYFVFEKGLSPGKILEIGCNSGRNLDLFQQVGWDVSGVDINVDSIEFCKMRFTKSSDSFSAVDIFNNQEYLAQFNDDHFEVCFSMGVLMHMPRSKEKDNLIKEMIRISKHTVLYEFFDFPKLPEPTELHDKGYYLVSEDYREYDEGFVLLPELLQTWIHFFARETA